MSVLVTDASGNHALAVVRSLGQHGIRVTAAESDRWAKAGFSRYCSARSIYPSPTRGVRGFTDGLLRILALQRPALLMPMTERTILALLANREEIESRVRLAPLPSEESIRIAFDKEATLRLAASLGIPTPRSLGLDRLGDLHGLRGAVSYPAVIKPRRSEVSTVDGRIVPAGTVAYCFRPEDLVARYTQVHRRAPLPLIQEFIPGDGYGVSVLCDQGRIRALFAHRRLRTIRPTGSGSSLRESITPPPAMAEAARSLMAALRWHGVAMVEFKLDRRDGIPKLMEINGRFWNSLPLAVAAGVDFPHLLYTLGTRGEAPECLDYKVGVRCRWLAGDVQHLVGALRGRPRGWPDEFPARGKSLREFFDLTGPDLHYDDLCLSDPLPFVADIVNGLLRRLPRLLVGGPQEAVVEAIEPRATREDPGLGRRLAG